MHRTWIALLLAASLAGCDGPAPGTDAGPEDDAGGQVDAGPVVETVPPTVTTTIPSDGDVEVSPTTSIRIVFSEPITTNGGSIELTAGDATLALGTPSLSTDARELTVSASAPLPGNAAITVAIDGYRDLAGNAMGAEHTFTFTTADPFAPTVTSATPAEGASAVALDTATLEVVFSEPMITTLGVAELSGGPGTIGAPTWDGARATFPVSGLAADTAYRVTLTGYADAAGNALDGSAYLIDGALDFTTGGDTVAPVVTEATPSEGQTAIPPSRTTRVSLVFSEPMDPTAGAAALEQGASTTPLEASWAAGNTILLLDVSGLMEADLAYRVTLTGYTDAAGNALDGTVYLGDGALDFTTGEDELAPFVLYTNPAETSTGTRWTTSSLFATFSEAMDPTIAEVPFTDGVSSGTFAASWSSGGTLLDIDVAGQLISGRTYVLDFTGFMDAEGSPLDTAHPYLGDGRLTFTTDTPRGENCQDFLTNAEATVTGETHAWSLARDQVINVDGAAPCDTSGGSPDAVIRYTKTSPDSTAATGGRVLRVTVTATALDVNVQVLSGACDPTSAPPATLTCRANDTPHTFDLDVPAGEYFVWIATSTGAEFRGATVSIEEIPAGLGDTCRNAIPITAGTTVITPTGTRDLFAPSCSAGSFTWYRYTAGQRLGLVTLNAPAAVGGMDGTTLEPLLCRSDAVTIPMPLVVEAGSPGCIAVASGAATSITIEELPYRGVRGVASDMGVEYPSGTTSAATLPVMAVTPTRLHVGSGSSVLHAPLTGGEATRTSRSPGIGQGGLAIGEVFYALSSGNVTTTPSARIFQHTDSTGAYLDPPIAIDTTFPYVPGPAMAAIIADGPNFLVAQDTTASVTVTRFYSVPITGGPVTEVGSNNTVDSVAAMALDGTYLYLLARIQGGGQESEGIYRLRRDELTNPDATPFLVFGDVPNWSDGTGGLALDSTGSTQWLYFRTYGPAHVHMLLDPASTTPRYLGTLWEQTTTNQTGMVYDPVAPAIYVINHDNSRDRWTRID